MYSTEEVDDVLVLEYLHQLNDLTLRVVTFLCHLDLIIEYHQVLLHELQERGRWTSGQPLP